LISANRPFSIWFTCLPLLAAAMAVLPMRTHAQSSAVDPLPDAPVATDPQISGQQSPGAPATTQPAAQTPPSGSSSSAQPAQSSTSSSSQNSNRPSSSSSNPPGQNGNTQSDSSSQSNPGETREQQRERAQQELKAEERQRALGVVPMFNVTSNADSAPLSSHQKFQLFFKSSTDWYVFAITAIDGEISMIDDEYPSYGEGVKGFAKYWGAAYTDTFDGNLWGNAILTSWWHEDPRYYRMGQGPFLKRAAWSAFSTIWCKRDKGTWGPNYANVAGNFIGGAISNIYYPDNQRGLGLTLGRGASVTYEGIVGAELAEFWPDVSRHLFKKLHEKQAQQADQQTASPTTTPGTRMQPQGNQTPTHEPPDEESQEQKAGSQTPQDQKPQ
jgi:hypothetical protein